MRDVLLFAATLGLLTGFGEAAGLYLLQKRQWAGEAVDTLLVSRAIFYLSPLYDAALFVVLALLLAAVRRVTRVRALPNAIFFLLFLTAIFDWLCLLLDRVMEPQYTAILSAGIATQLTRWAWPRREAVLGASRRALPALAAVVALLMILIPLRDLYAAPAPGAAANAPAGAANVLIVVMDTVRADHLSIQGYARQTSPNLARLASEGSVFENAFSTSSWTLPGHVSLLTGKFPFEHGAEVKAYDGRYPLLSEAFEARGYRTGAFSGNPYYFARENGLGRGFLYFDGAFTRPGDVLMRTLFGRFFMIVYEQLTAADTPGRKRAAEMSASFLRWLDAGQGRPFFAVINYYDAHDPYLPPQPFRNRFSEKPNPGGELNGWGSRLTLQRPADVEGEKAAYDGAIAYEDDQLGVVLDALRERKLIGNTLIIVVGDHGEFFGEHGLYLHKNALYLEGIHVPLVMAWPGRVPSGGRLPAPESIAAIPASVMALMPGKGTEEFRGRPLGWNAAPPEDQTLVLSEIVTYGPRGRPVRNESLLDSRWHFILTEGQPPQLFEWQKDRAEAHNVAETEEGRPVVERMMKCYREHFAGIRNPGCSLNVPSAGGN